MIGAEVVSPSELASAHRLIREVWPVDGPASEMHVGDLYWSLFHRPLRDPESPVALWYDAAGALQGMTLFPGQTWCDIVLRPAHFASSLGEEMVAWAVEQWRRKNPAPSGTQVLRIGRRVRSPERLAFLERLGFERMNFGYLAFAVDAHAEGQRRELPAGFVCRPLQPEDIPSRVAAYNLAFPGEDLSAEDHAIMRACPGSDPALDLVVVDPSGSVVAFCTLWMDDANGTGLLEPVGCHPEFRRRGLTQFVISAGLQRSWARGAKQVIVRVHSENTAAQMLYQSCGFSSASTAFGHEKRIV
jgi:ribosomal protein S18 acetylase RimI-like enzyme